jgi:CubicO group peptidase (beta-lactamase class C family)
MRLAGVAVFVCALGALVPGAEGGRSAHPERVPPARFEDEGRAKKLAAAFSEVDRAFATFAERTRVPGVAWGVIVDGALVHEGALGVRDVESGAPVRGDSVFRTASMTKSFTALAVLKLRDERRLSLDDPVARHVPELAALPYPTRDSPAITIRHLLTHAEGFPEDNPWGDRQLAVSDALLSAWMRKGIPFSNAPGVAFEYSNYGFGILGQVVARVSGRPYRDYVSREVLAPLGMDATVWEAASVPRDRLARGYRSEGGQFVEEPPLVDGAFGAMGGLYSSVPDLARWVGLFLSAWPPRDDEERGPLRRASLREMQQAARPYRASATRPAPDAPLRLSAGGYAYGLSADQSCRFAHIVSHSGGLPGYGSIMRWLPEHGVGIVALANATYTAPGRASTEALEALHATGALQPRVPQPAPALLAAREGVDRLLASWDDTRYEALAADNLSLDRPREARRSEFEALRAAHGACRPQGPLRAENALRGEWWLECERGKVRLSLTLAPTRPPRIQDLALTSVLPPTPALREAASRLAARVGAAAPAVDDLLAPGADSGQVARAVGGASAWGSCRVGGVEAGGQDGATFRFDCDKGTLAVRLALDEPTGRLSSVTVDSSSETCIP